MRKPFHTISFSLGVFVCALPSAVTGASLIYEGFDYGLSNKAINGTATTATGLSGSYTTVINGNAEISPSAQTSTYLATGLSFEGLATSGGALMLSVKPTTDLVKEFVYTHIPINVSVSAGTTVYQSMLVQLSANSLSTNTGDASIRVTASTNLTGNSNGSMVNGIKRANTSGSGVYYAAADGAPTGSAVISTSTTYLYISKFTNVGGAGGGDATTWILTEAQFAAWVLDGGTEAELDSVVGVFKSTKTSTAAIAFDSTKSLRFSTSEFSVDFNSGTSNYSNSGELTTVFDELRFGTSLTDVLSFSQVPEPSTYASIVGGLMLGLVVLRRRRN